MSTYLVTGGAGFIGSHLVEVLLNEGHRVRVLDNFSIGDIANVPVGAQVIAADIADYDAIRPTFDGIDGVFHFAGLSNVQRSIDQPKETHDVNLTGTLHVLEAARAAGVRRVVFASSAAVYGDQDAFPYHEGMEPRPKSPYALQKFIGEERCKTYASVGGLETVCLRFANVYGPRQSDDGPYANVFPIFLRQRRAGQPLTVTGDGAQTRDFVHVRDVARAALLAMESTHVGRGEAINIGSGARTSVRAIARMFGGPTVRIAPRIEQRHAQCDIRRSRMLLGWVPTITLEDGIRALLAPRGAEASVVARRAAPRMRARHPVRIPA